MRGVGDILFDLQTVSAWMERLAEVDPHRGYTMNATLATAMKDLRPPHDDPRPPILLSAEMFGTVLGALEDGDANDRELAATLLRSLLDDEPEAEAANTDPTSFAPEHEE